MTIVKNCAVLLAGVALAYALLLPTSSIALAPDPTPAATALKSVVSILPEWPPDKRRTEEPEASGVVWSDGRHIVTAFHVVANAKSLRVRTSDGLILQGELVGSDPATDLAVIRVDQALSASTLAEGSPGIGQRVCAIGNAFGLGLSLTCGVVSAVNRAGVGFNPIEDFIQTDAAVNPGASGGALVTEDGAVVGILSAIFTKKADANIGVNFAVSIPLTKRITNELIETGRVRHVKTGLRLAPARFQGRPAQPEPLAPRVVAVAPNSAAERAGIKVGDEITEAGNRRIKTPAEFVGVSAINSGHLDLVVIRSGNRHKLSIEPPEKGAQ